MGPGSPKRLDGHRITTIGSWMAKRIRESEGPQALGKTWPHVGIDYLRTNAFPRGSETLTPVISTGSSPEPIWYADCLMGGALVLLGPQVVVDNGSRSCAVAAVPSR